MYEEKVIIFSKVIDKIRIAIIEDDKLSEIFFEDFETDKNTGKIFLGTIENNVPSLEAFFVNIGAGKNGFLRYRDVIGDPTDYKNGQKVLVQARKDGGTRKGPQLSMKISLPGRYLVYIPYGEKSIGISRKITHESERFRLREVAKRILKEGESVIFRTNSEGLDEKELSQELENLRKDYNKISEEFNKNTKPKVLYEDSDFIEYILRERLDTKTKKIVVDDKKTFKELKKSIKTLKLKPGLELLKGDAFEIYNVYNQMNEIFTKKVVLENGGTITIDKAEALTAIDVDSASYIEGKNVEETSYMTNCEAAKEIIRQLRLRNIGGMIVVDFIDMNYQPHKKEIVNILKEEALKDKSKISVLGFTNMGLLEMIRKRTTPSLDSLIYFQCPVCHGTGKIISPAIIFGKLLKELENISKEIKKEQIKEIEIYAFHNLSGYLTPELQNELKNKLKMNIQCFFTWQDPNSYNIKYKK